MIPRQFTKRMSEARIAMMALQRHKPKAAYVLDFMTWHMKKNNALTISIDALSEILDISRSTVEKSVAQLKKNNFIHSVRTGRSNTYYINPKVCKVTDDRNGSMFYVFKGNVILSDSEIKELASHIKFTEQNLAHEIK